MPNANRLVSSLSGYFDDHLPPNLGNYLYGLISKRLRYEGYPDHFHVEEVFSMALVSALRHLCRHGGASIRQPLVWLRVLSLRSCIDYLKALAAHRTYALAPLHEDETQLFDNHTPLTEEHALELVRQALEQLRPRHRHLIVLDLVECLSPTQIQQAMQLPSNGAFRKLKHEAFTALREVIRPELGGDAESTYLFLGGGASMRKPGRAPAAVSPLGATRQPPLKTRTRLASRRRVPRPPVEPSENPGASRKEHPHATSILTVRHLPGSSPPHFQVIGADGQATSPKPVPPAAGFPVAGRPGCELMNELRWYLEDFLAYPFSPETEHAEQVLAALERWGKDAVDALFGDRDGGALLDAATPKGQAPQRLQVCSDDPAVLAWPWEAIQLSDAGPLGRAAQIERRLDTASDSPPLASPGRRRLRADAHRARQGRASPGRSSG